jgi:hypothetical protein
MSKYLRILCEYSAIELDPNGVRKKPSLSSIIVQILHVD